MLLTFLDPKGLQLSIEFVNCVLQCCFQLFESKSNAVKSTIQATLRQLYTIVFEAFLASCSSVVPPEIANKVFHRKHMQLKRDEEEILQKSLLGLTNSVEYKVVYDLIQNMAVGILMIKHSNTKQSMP